MKRYRFELVLGFVLLATLFSIVLILIHHIHLLMYVPTIAVIVVVRHYVPAAFNRTSLAIGVVSTLLLVALFVAMQFWGTMPIPQADFVAYLKSRMADPSRTDMLGFSYIWYQPLAKEISDTFLAKTTAYAEIWLNGEHLNRETKDAEPIYGKLYLPRKFKIGIAIPPRNDIDIYTNDLGFISHVENGVVTGYTVVAGGGFGMAHGQTETFPALAKPLFYVAREHAVKAAVAVVSTQRDFGNRSDRKPRQVLVQGSTPGTRHARFQRQAAIGGDRED